MSRYDVDFALDQSHYFGVYTRDLRACSPEITEYAMRILIREIPMYHHSKMHRLLRQRILSSPILSGKEKLRQLEKLNDFIVHIAEELK